MDFLYRKALASDVGGALSLRREVIKGLEKEGLFIWDDEYPSEETFREDIGSGLARLLFFGNHLIGYCSIGVAEEEFGEDVFEEPGLMSFSRLMVHKDIRGKGAGRFLVQRLLEELAGLGAPGVGILVHPVNEGALRFYEKLSFENLGPIRNEWGEFIRMRYKFPINSK